MRITALAVLQFLLFLFVMAAGSFAVPFHLQRVVYQTGLGTRVFVWDGVVLAFALYLVILLVELLSRRARPAALWTTISLFAAIAVGLAMKLGFITREF